jgi:hypothetical protein
VSAGRPGFWAGRLQVRDPGRGVVWPEEKAGQGSQPYLGARARGAGPGHRMMDWVAPACRGAAAQSFEAVRQPAPRCGNPGGLTGGRQEPAAVVPHRLDDGAHARFTFRRDWGPAWRSHRGEGVVAELGQDVAGPADDLAGL